MNPQGERILVENIRDRAASHGRPRAPLVARAGRVRTLLRDPSVRLALLATLAMRVVLQVALLVGHALHGTSTAHGAYTTDIESDGRLWWLTGLWERWDTLWLVHIARIGYPRGRPDVAFFPLYPGVVHLVGVMLGGAFFLAALIVSTLALVAALAVLHRLLRDDLGDRVATRTVVLLCVFPTAFYLAAPYTESLFLLMSAAAMMAMRRRRFGYAAGAAALAALCRPQGVLLAVPLAVELGVDLRRRQRAGERISGADLVTAGAELTLPMLATAGWYAVSRVAIGTSGGFIGAQTREWGAAAAPPWTTLSNSVIAVAHGRDVEMLNLACLGIGLVALAAMLWTRRLPWSYVAFAAVMLLPSLLRGSGGTPLQSLDRYTLVVFPVFAMAAFLRLPRLLEATAVCASAGWMIYLLDASMTFHFVG